MNYCADDKGINIDNINYCSTCASIKLECCRDNVCSNKARILKSFDDVIYAVFEKAENDFLCEITVNSIDELFESYTAQRYCFNAKCTSPIPDDNFAWGTKDLTDLACMNSPRNFAKCGQPPIQMYSKEYIYFKNSRLVSDLTGEVVFLGQVKKNVVDFFAKEVDNETMFYFVDDENNIQKAFMPHNQGFHDHIIMSLVWGVIKINYVLNLHQGSSLTRHTHLTLSRHPVGNPVVFAIHTLH